MSRSQHQENREKKTWTTPELKEISGLDSCVEFLYGGGGATPDPGGGGTDCPPGVPC